MVPFGEFLLLLEDPMDSSSATILSSSRSTTAVVGEGVLPKWQHVKEIKQMYIESAGTEAY